MASPAVVRPPPPAIGQVAVSAGADEVRAQLKALGIELEDKPGGVTQWRRH